MDELDKLERSQNANSIIKNHMLWAMGAGLIPVPIADFFAVSAIQLDMVRQMCKLYELNFKESEGKAVITALTGSGLAKVGARVAIKFIPGIGSVVGGVSMAVLSGASTYGVGQAFKRHFETGGTILDFDLKRLKKVYDEQFEKGKEVAREMKARQEREKAARTSMDVKEKEGMKPAFDDSGEETDLVRKLRELARLKEDGIITEEDFQVLKGRLINQTKV